MADPTFISSDAVATMLQIRKATFLGRRSELEIKHDFPAPMPHSRRPLLWRRDQIAAWIERYGRTALAPPSRENVLVFPKAQAT